MLWVSPNRIFKILIFLVNGSPRLAISTGLTRLDINLLAAAFGVSRRRVRFATADQALDIMGFQVGSMPPFGHRTCLYTVVDNTLVSGQMYYAGGGSSSAMIEIDVQKLVAITGAKCAPLTKG